MMKNVRIENFELFTAKAATKQFPNTTEISFIVVRNNPGKGYGLTTELELNAIIGAAFLTGEEGAMVGWIRQWVVTGWYQPLAQ